jgi:hypothetical protein
MILLARHRDFISIFRVANRRIAEAWTEWGLLEWADSTWAHEAAGSIGASGVRLDRPGSEGQKSVIDAIWNSDSFAVDD